MEWLDTLIIWGIPIFLAGMLLGRKITKDTYKDAIDKWEKKTK